MNWYCALTKHLLNEYNIKIGNESFEAILHQLKGRVVALYKALLYQMKSVCSYYRNQGLTFLRGLVNLDDWDGDLRSVTDAEDALRKDSDLYIDQRAKSFLATLVEAGGKMTSLLGDLYQVLRDYIVLQKKIQMNNEDTICL
jgi:N-terminal domain of NWD NACHT-NTPase